MRVAFLYNESTEDPALVAEEPDPARSPIVAALRRLGHTVAHIACTLDLAAVGRRLERLGPEIALNRVESLGGSDAMMAAVPLLLETMQIPYTGCSAEALAATASKLAVKERLTHAGLPTPPWIALDRVASLPEKASEDVARREHANRDSRFIIKSVYEHSSFQLDDASIVGPVNAARIRQVLQQRQAECGRPFFAEQFIDGREFNLSVVGDKPEVLPPAEIDFSDLPGGKPHIVNHGAKCDASSFEFHHTPRRFNFSAHDAGLLRQLCELASECSRLFHLDGYARIDFRCDAADRPWILEVNSNPCLSPNAGFAAAMQHAGYEYDATIQRLLNQALARSGRLKSTDRRSRHRSRKKTVVPTTPSSVPDVRGET